MHSRASQRQDRRRDEADETPLQQVVAGVVIALILVVAFGLLALGWPWFWVVFPVGFAGVLPAALGLAKLYEQRRERGEAADSRESSTTVGGDRDTALATLRERFARGDIDEETFERQVAALLETGSVDEATAYLDREPERTVD